MKTDSQILVDPTVGWGLGGELLGVLLGCRGVLYRLDGLSQTITIEVFEAFHDGTEVVRLQEVGQRDPRSSYAAVE